MLTNYLQIIKYKVWLKKKIDCKEYVINNNKIQRIDTQ